MQPVEQPNFNWQALGVIAAIMTTIVTGAIVLTGAYLKMFINGKVSEVENKLNAQITSTSKEIMTTIEGKFSQKELTQMQLNEQNQRLLKIEAKMESIRLAKEYDDRK
jgi:hypothetical protein